MPQMPHSDARPAFMRQSTHIAWCARWTPPTPGRGASTSTTLIAPAETTTWRNADLQSHEAGACVLDSPAAVVVLGLLCRGSVAVDGGREFPQPGECAVGEVVLSQLG